MAETFDEYSDVFLLTTSPFGAALTFRRSPAVTASPGTTSQPEDVGVIRMSLEHLKMMAFIFKRQIDGVERNVGASIPIASSTLNQMKIAPEDWDSFWKG